MEEYITLIALSYFKDAKGRYTINELTEKLANYGLTYNKKLFFVDYQVIGENIAPDIVVIERSPANE